MRIHGSPFDDDVRAYGEGSAHHAGPPAARQWHHPEMPREIASCVERANLDPEVHVIALAGNGKGFCGGYDLVVSAELVRGRPSSSERTPRGLADRSGRHLRKP